MARANLGGALRRARTGLLMIALVYAVTLSLGMAMVHAGNGFALRVRDSLVARAHQSDPASTADDQGQHVRAAAMDFSRNLFMAAVPETVGGLVVILPPALAAYRGWVGGIVSVDSMHRSRLARPSTAAYYVVTLLLQLAAFTLAGGGGVHLGLAFFAHRGPFVGPSWFRIPRPALVDVAWLYTLAVPFFALGSAWEFLGPLA